VKRQEGKEFPLRKPDVEFKPSKRESGAGTAVVSFWHLGDPGVLMVSGPEADRDHAAPSIVSTGTATDAATTATEISTARAFTKISLISSSFG